MAEAASPSSGSARRRRAQRARATAHRVQWYLRLAQDRCAHHTGAAGGGGAFGSTHHSGGGIEPQSTLQAKIHDLQLQVTTLASLVTELYQARMVGTEVKEEKTQEAAFKEEQVEQPPPQGGSVTAQATSHNCVFQVPGTLHGVAVIEASAAQSTGTQGVATSSTFAEPGLLSQAMVVDRDDGGPGKCKATAPGAAVLKEQSGGTTDTETGFNQEAASRVSELSHKNPQGPRCRECLDCGMPVLRARGSPLCERCLQHERQAAWWTPRKPYWDAGWY